MYALLSDTLNLLRFRVFTITHYRYPAWQMVLTLLLLGVFSAANAASVMQGSISNLIVFFVLFTMTEITLMSRFFGWWLRLAKWPYQGSLIGLILAVNAFQLVQPLLSWLPDNYAMAASILMGIYSVVVLVFALTRVSGVSWWRVLIGLIIFAPIVTIFTIGALTLGNNIGLIQIPVELMTH